MKKGKDFILGFLTVNLIWFFAAILLDIPVLPSPLLIYSSMGEILNGMVCFHILTSLGRIGGALCISLLIGVPLGLLIAQKKKFGRAVNPLVYFFYPVPKTALLPVAMLLLGLGNGSKLSIMVLTMIFPIIVTVRDAVGHISPGIYQVAQSAGLSSSYVLRHVTLPAILPELFTGLRISIGTALAILFIVEAYGTRYGIGYYILDSWSRIDYITMYGGILLIGIVGAMLFLLIDLLAGRICRWNR